MKGSRHILPTYITDEELFSKVIEGLREGRIVALAIIVEKTGSGPRRPGAKMVIYDDGRCFGTLGGGVFERLVIKHAMEAIREGKPRIEKYSFFGREVKEVKAHETGLICGGVVTVYIDVIKPVPTAYIVGAGRIGKPLADLLNMIGLRVVVADPNKGLLSKEIYPYAEKLFHGAPDEIGRFIEASAKSRDIIIIAHGETDVDVTVLRHALRSKAGFIGVLGSRRKVIEYAKMLVREGFNIDDIVSRVRAPIGIDIGAETPEEISISIVSQIISWIHGVESDSYRQLNILRMDSVIDTLRKEAIGKS